MNKYFKYYLCGVLILLSVLIYIIYLIKNQTIPDMVFCIASIDNGEFKKLDSIYINSSQNIEIRPVFLKNKQYYSSVSSFLMGSEITYTKPYDIDCDWYMVSPVFKEGGYDNFEKAPKNNLLFYKEPINYNSQKIESNKEILTFSDFSRADIWGTYYIRPVLRNTEVIDFSCTEEISGIENTIKIVCRKDDSYLGYLTELMETPFIMFPKVTESNKHQTDACVGSDCAEFAIYGMRRMGVNIPYCGPEKIYDYVIPISNKSISVKTIGGIQKLCDANGKELIVGEGGTLPGDILHYGTQVAVFYEDKGIIGILDNEDIIIQSYGEKPHFTTFKENAKKFGMFMIYRWDSSN